VASAGLSTILSIFAPEKIIHVLKNKKIKFSFAKKIYVLGSPGSGSVSQR
jgi:hypothetical protein